MPDISLESARALHEKLFVMDTHLDTPTASFMQPGWDFGARQDWKVDGSQCDLPRLQAGGVDAAVFAVYVMQAARTAEGYAAIHTRALDVFARTHEVLRAHAGRCALALAASDGPRLQAEGRAAIYLGLENCYSLGRDAGNVGKFHALGVRMLGLTHMLNNDVADSSTDPRGPEWGGLSPLGREIVAECNRLGIVLDASHASDAALADLLALSESPVILSHSGCRAICDHPRNVGDDLLRELAAQGGVLQVNALAIALVNSPDQGRTAAQSALLLRFKDAVPTPGVRAAVSKAWGEVDRAYPPPAPTMDDFVDHIEHAVEIMGIDHVGIGCDLDGGGGFAGLRDVGDYPAITRALLARGWVEADLAKLWGENTLRVLGAA